LHSAIYKEDLSELRSFKQKNHYESDFEKDRKNMNSDTPDSSSELS